jgi:hypothetical protein
VPVVLGLAFVDLPAVEGLFRLSSSDNPSLDPGDKSLGSGAGESQHKEKKMKFRLIDIYNHKLTERIRRKEFVISRKLLDLKEQNRLDKTRTKEEKEIYNMMKVFARFSTAE